MRTRWLAFSAGAIVLGTVFVLLRGEPWIRDDPGVFLSVAARLLDGDRLYADVFDNKDPLFYYTFAGRFGWVGGPFRGGGRSPLPPELRCAIPPARRA
jgi:hypothetical protein